MVGRGELTDAAWERIAPLLPGVDGRGRPWRDHRQVINGVLWRLRTGAPWRDLPERYGPWQMVYERFARWEADGTWARLLEEVQVRDDSVGLVEWTVSVDSTINRAHQHAAGARKKGPQAGDELEDPKRAGHRQALGRSRGGLTTKVHLACDGWGLPLAAVVTPGNVNDSTAFDAVLEAVRVPRTGVGRPRRRPDAVIADKAYSSRAIRQTLRRRGIRAVIPERADQKTNRMPRGRVGGRPPAFDRDLYKARNVVERCFNRLKQFRAIAARFDCEDVRVPLRAVA
ncbi:IS5 family transposase [Streptomyces murinus]|nr:IS5 family transposase [Streptomyces murinus]WSI89850.1 IS5 family transposase [Streptomyces murinus]